MSDSAPRAFYAFCPTPWGDLMAVVDELDRLIAVAFLNEDRKPDCVQSWPATRASLEKAGFKLVESAERTAAARLELEEYAAGKRQRFSVAVAPRGTAFQRQVWELLRAIPFGETQTYGELARALGRPRAARAVGRAVATNPVSLVIPCHRVLGADGTLTGFAGGLAFKQGLLELEGRKPS